MGTDSPGNTVHLGAAEGLGLRFENYTSGNSSYLTLETGDLFSSNVGGAGTFAWTTGGTRKMTLTQAGGLGIGTDDPTDGVDAESDDLVIYRASGAAGMTIKTAANATGAIRFADPDATSQGRIEYNHTDNYLRWNTDGSERLRVTSTGKLEAYKGTSTTGKVSGSEAFTVGNGAGNHRFAVYPDGTTVIGGTGDIGNHNILLQNDGKAYFDDNVGIKTSIPAHNLDVYLSGRFNQLGQGGHGLLVGPGSNYGGFTYKSSGDIEISCAQTTKDIVFSDAIGGNERMRLTGDTGRLGIGSAIPDGVLDLYHPTSNTILNVKSGDAGAVLNLIDDSARSSIEQNGTTLKISSDTGAEFADSDIRLQVDGASKMIIRSDGDVVTGNPAHDNTTNNGTRTSFSIADTTNGALLQIRGQSPAIFFDQSGGNIGKVFLDSVDFAIQSGTPASEGTERLRITGIGSVGIGVADPTERLHVDSTLLLGTSSGSGSSIKFTRSGQTSAGQVTSDSSSNLLIETGGSERVRIDGSNGAIGLAGANYGTSGQVITSNGSGSAPTWQDVSSGAGSIQAWVNFDGSSGSIGSGRANGNVSSVGDNGTGDYTVNFSTAISDANYTALAGGTTIADSSVCVVHFNPWNGSSPTAPSTSAIELETRVSSNSALKDADYGYVAIVR